MIHETVQSFNINRPDHLTAEEQAEMERLQERLRELSEQVEARRRAAGELYPWQEESVTVMLKLADELSLTTDDVWQMRQTAKYERLKAWLAAESPEIVEVFLTRLAQ